LSTSLLIIAVVVAIGTTGATFARAAPVSFPGPVKEVNSPDGRAKVDYYDPAENADGFHLYQLRLRYQDGRVDKLDEFTREVEVAWSPSGDRLYATDFIGSNVADCLVVTPTRGHTLIRSVTDAVRRAALPGISKDLDGDHVYVGCDRWRSPRILDIYMEGSAFPRSFKHHFEYDAFSDQISKAAR
jgi:hypothetical protein